LSVDPQTERTGILLFNLGGPEKLEDVRPFLFNLFGDPDIIRLPWRAMQKPLAWAISTQRYRKSQSYYRKIGGGSPLRRITEQQARALEAELSSRGIEARAYVAMRYWKPFTEEAVERIEADGITRLIILPLYPQFSISTTGSSLNLTNRLFQERGTRPKIVSVIRSWQRDTNYISALAESIKEQLVLFPDQDPKATRIVFSAHSVPVRYIDEGDPYLEQTQETVGETMQRLGDRPHALSFQSKVGPVEWLRPSTDETIRQLAGEGVRQVLLVPISFVSEHIETLYELDILYRDVAAEVGIEHYRRVPALNCRADFIAGLADLVQRELVTSEGAGEIVIGDSAGA
jgi:ferrochelatase